MARPLPMLDNDRVHGSPPAPVPDPASPALHRPSAGAEAPVSFGGAGAVRPRLLLFFIDGLGVGEDDPDVNPLATGEFPALRLTHSQKPVAGALLPAAAHGIDAALGIPGL